MAVYLVAYDLIKRKDYPKLLEELERLKAHKTQYSLWLINLNNTAKEVVEHFQQLELADHATQLTRVVDHRSAADPVVEQHADRSIHRGFRANGNHVMAHGIFDLIHWALQSVTWGRVQVLVTIEALATTLPRGFSGQRNKQKNRCRRFGAPTIAGASGHVSARHQKKQVAGTGFEPATSRL